MATLIGSSDKKYSSVEIKLSVSDIYLEDTVRVPNEVPMPDEYIKVDIVYRFIRNDQKDELHWDMNAVEPSGQDATVRDITVLIDKLRKQAKSKIKKEVEVFEETYVMFDINFFAEPGYKNRVDVSASGAFGVDDALVMRLYPSDEKLLQFATELEKELEKTIRLSRKKYPERVKKYKDLLKNNTSDYLLSPLIDLKD